MKLQKRILFSVLGVAVGGVSVGLFRTAELGVDPFQSLMSGLEARDRQRAPAAGLSDL